MKKILFCAAAAALAFSSCKKSSGNEALAITKENLIGTYKMTAMTISINGIKQDGMSSFDPCEKDDLYVLKAGDAFDYTDAGTVCSPDGSYSGSWSLSSNVITVDGQAATITTLTSTKLETTQTVNVQGVNWVTTTTLTRQ